VDWRNALGLSPRSLRCGIRSRTTAEFEEEFITLLKSKARQNMRDDFGPTMISRAVERLNNKLSLLAAAGGIAAAVAPDKVLPFIYNHRVVVCIYLIVGVAPIQELFHPIKTLEEMRTDRLGLVWLAKFALLWALVLVSIFLLLLHV